MAQPEVPPEILGPLRAVCLALPDVYEETAWVGKRWCVRRRTFVHVLQVDREWPPAYAKAAGTTGPVFVLTFRSSGQELETLRVMGPPFFKPGWGDNVVGMMLTGRVDWAEVGELVTESYCVLAPKKLVALVPRPEVG
ncbi:MAG: MmcQ/YjbR family DNA-binding protein [Actinophytocola sp.]|uniref:MmcQ/YjbR family DNA-binding protein n=1 Tax=Actinophytocola sp. TaxID=1872138 RepID=UPI0013224D44|nr:MmcQ/YjbR family DNA-binding protein [Actinophytocola sp.]MPZ79170.1 MmcQ/YjbR family DNA-binding protein [Actinophytocola sp.]